MFLLSRFISSAFALLVISFSLKQVCGGNVKTRIGDQLASWFADYKINVPVAENDYGVRVARNIKGRRTYAKSPSEENAVKWYSLPGTDLGVFELLQLEAKKIRAEEALPICFEKLLWKEGMDRICPHITFIGKLPDNFENKNIQVVGVEYFWRYSLSTKYSLVIVFKLQPTIGAIQSTAISTQLSTTDAIGTTAIGIPQHTTKASETTVTNTRQPTMEAVEITPISSFESINREEQAEKGQMTRDQFIRKIDESTKTAMTKNEGSYLVPGKLNITGLVVSRKFCT